VRWDLVSENEKRHHCEPFNVRHDQISGS
jgi:hypothetical protein